MGILKNLIKETKNMTTDEYEKLYKMALTQGCNGPKACKDRKFDPNMNDCQECVKDAEEAVAEENRRLIENIDYYGKAKKTHTCRWCGYQWSHEHGLFCPKCARFQ